MSLHPSSMDRTMIAPRKAEEKEQSEKLHKKLQGLSLLYPMTDEMVKLLAWDMFLKPNQAAFFQVMHYLFRILDPVEFKRRFYWPIVDKKAEAIFRSSTVDYLKHLNEKHQLNWTNIKSYLVVMPGGMKFINFLLDLVSFVVQELTKQREKALLTDGFDISTLRSLSVHSMSAQSSLMKEYASGYSDELKQSMSKLRQCTQKIRDIFSEVARKTGVDETLILDDQFLEDFEASNRIKCQKKITQPAEGIATLEGPLCVLKDAMDQFLAKQTEQKQNQETADNTLRSIQKLFGSTTGAGHATANSLLSALNDISETVAQELDANDHYNDSNEFVTADLKELRNTLQQIEIQVNDVQKNLNLRVKEHSSNLSGNVSQQHLGNTMQLPVPSTPHQPLNNQTVSNTHPVLMKFVSTPPIKLEGTGTGRKVHVRLPLQDDFNAKQFENSLLAPAPPRSVRKTKPQDQSMELNSTFNRSKILDPMQLLRTINKKSKPVAQSNLSNLGSKWKQLHASFGFDDATQVAPTSPKPNAAIVQSPFTPLNCNEHTRIERQPKAQVADLSNNSMYAKSAAVMKVLDSSLNVQNLSTSPSGRLEALVAGPLIEQKVTPRLLVNDQPLVDSPKDEKNNGNQWNPLPSKFDLSFAELGDEDDLQNVSDSVLNDILN